MALKATVNEKCENCGKRAATLYGDYVVENHKCEFDPPGPACGPRRMPLSQINFVRGVFTVEEITADLDAANVKISELSARSSSYMVAMTMIQRAVNMAPKPPST
jgi:hypothetical protein